MSDEKASTKTPAQLLQEAEVEHAEAVKSGDVARIFFSYGTLLQAKQNAKPWDQRQNEEKERLQRDRLTAIEKQQKEQRRLETLYQIWIKRDSWLVWREAMHLMIGVEPTSIDGFFDPRDTNLWDIAQSCAGKSLSILNISAKPKEWRVSPFEWVRWLKEKGFTPNPILERLLYPVSDLTPTVKTAEAITSRSIKKAKRQKALKQFSDEAAIRARKSGHQWSDQNIPITKLDFIRVFKKEYPALKDFSIESFNRDIADIGIKFARGTKSNKNNILKQLYLHH